MDQFFIYIALLCASLVFIYYTLFYKRSDVKLPPGRKGWPIIGETYEYFMAGRLGRPQKFVNDRMEKFSSDVFRTSLVGIDMAVFCGAAGNKFLFTKENQYVTSWWPKAFEKILMSEESQGKMKEESKDMRYSFLPEFLKPEALQVYTAIMDNMVKQHLETEWVPHKQVKVFPLAKKYTFALACNLLMSVNEPDHIERISRHYTDIVDGMFSLPLNVPGMAFNRAVKAGKRIRDELRAVVSQRRKEVLENKETGKMDVVTRLLKTSDQSDSMIADKIIGLLLASFKTVSTSITFLINFLADYPDVYEKVLKEQMEIAKSKGPGEPLNWQDIQKMKYSWCVACESLRLVPPAAGSFREVIKDFTYAGFTIPKGWKTHWSVHSTHKSPKYFPDPEKFDPTRFEGSGPTPYSFVAFGGGPRMCPGKEFARLEMLTFIHSVVIKFKISKVNPDEKILYHRSPYPENGLLVRLEPHDN